MALKNDFRDDVVVSKVFEKGGFPNITEWVRKDLIKIANDLNIEEKYVDRYLNEDTRVGWGRYDFSFLLTGTPVVKMPPKQVVPPKTVNNNNVSSHTNEETSYVPEVDPSYISWGHYYDLMKIVKSKQFFPVFISGLSGNGKTMMVEQICAKANKEYVRVQISPETDEDSLIGGFRLINGETVFHKGPVIHAMERGAILLIDEIDRATNRIMCLQGVMEGKPVLIKKTGETVYPANGFNVIATANTKGQGSDDGKFVAATIIDEAFLERFVITLEQPYPTQASEKKIVMSHMDKYSCVDEDFATLLTTWADVIRATYRDGGVNEVISTRRLCHIVKTFSIFPDRLKAIKLCLSRFDDENQEAFLDLYTKVDSPEEEPESSSNDNLDENNNL